MDPVTQAVLDDILDSLSELRGAIEGVTAEGLNWRPGDDTNSIAVQVAHSLASARFWLSAAVSQDADRAGYVERREASFRFGADLHALAAMIDEAEADLRRLAAVVRADDLGSWRDWPGLFDEGPVSAAWCLIHAAAHLREHVGSCLLTRQLWFLNAPSQSVPRR